MSSFIVLGIDSPFSHRVIISWFLMPRYAATCFSLYPLIKRIERNLFGVFFIPLFYTLIAYLGKLFPLPFLTKK